MGSIAVVVWGVVAGRAIGVWILAAILAIGPMLTASLFGPARHRQVALGHALAPQAQLTPASVGARRG